jgi:hypothetical protein
MCTKYKTHRLLRNIQASVNLHIRDSQTFRNGEQIAWSTFGGEIPDSEGGIAIFPLDISESRGIEGRMIKQLLEHLCWADCETCGSVALIRDESQGKHGRIGRLVADFMELDNFGEDVKRPRNSSQWHPYDEQR